MILLTALVACVSPEPRPPPPPDKPPAARVVVLVVVDQLGWDLFASLKDDYQYGLRRMIDDGYVAPARHAHAATLTCPGHATIATGTAPSVHGIIGNEWRTRDAETYCGDPALLRVPGIADAVKAAGGTVVALSLKDRGAILMGGHTPDQVAWWGDAARFYGTPDAPWLAVPTAPGSWATSRGPRFETMGIADDNAWEGTPDGVSVKFPHPIDPAAKGFLATTAAGTALTDLAIAAITAQHLGADDTPDLLAISYSQIDYIGHAYTAKSWEALDGMLALDADLGRLFDVLNANVGVGAWSVVLSADHGGAPPSDVRFAPGELVKQADAALVALGEPAGATYDNPTIFLPEVLRADPIRRTAAAKAVAAQVSAVPGVEAYAWREPDGLPTDFPHAEALQLSFDAERSGDVFVLPDLGAIPHWNEGPPTGTSHGTPYDYDQLVPVLLYGAGVARAAPTAEVDTRQIAATAAGLIGLTLAAPAMAPISH